MRASMAESQRGMRMRPSICMVAVALALFGVARSTAQSPESSPRQQLKQCVADLQKSPSDDSLREKIIKLALTLHPQPAAPPEADELAGRAKYIFDHANSNDDLLKAADAFGKVSLIVPWVPDYYFDGAVAYEKANDPANALRNYKWCLLAGPDSQDAKAVREKIGALSYVLEQQQATAQAEQARRDAAAQAERQRELEAERAREQAQREEQQRLANLDPVVRQLDGTSFVNRHRMGTVPESYATTTYTIHGDRISVEEYWQGSDKNYTYQINGRQFDEGAWETRDRCDDGRIITDRHTVGTIAPDAITFATQDTYGQICWRQTPSANAKRVK